MSYKGYKDEILDERVRADARVLKFRRNPNRLPGSPRLGAPAMSDPVTPDTEVKPAAPAVKPVLPQALVIVLTLLASIAAAVPFIPGMPAVASAIASAVVAIAAAFGIASPGLQKKQ